MTTIEIILVSIQGFSAVLLVALLVATAQRAARARTFEEGAATRDELEKTAERLAAKVAELEERLAGKADLEAATAELPRRSDLSEAIGGLPKVEDVREATEPLAHRTDLREATEGLAKRSDVVEALKPYPTSADFNALMDSLLARQTSEVAHRLDTLAEEVAAMTSHDNGADNGFPPEVGESLTGKSIDAAMALFEAAEELLTDAGIPLEDLPRDGGASIKRHQEHCLETAAKVQSAERVVELLFAETSPVRETARALAAAAEAFREAMRGNTEVMGRAALNGAAPGTTSAQRLAHRQAEQRARDAQREYAELLAPLRFELGRAFDRYSDALNTQIHGTKTLEA